MNIHFCYFVCIDNFLPASFLKLSLDALKIFFICQKLLNLLSKMQVSHNWIVSRIRNF